MESPPPTIWTKSCLSTLGFLLCASIIIRTATAESPFVVSSIENDLEFDENQKLARHYVVFPANRPDCPTKAWETGVAQPGYGYTAHPVEGDALAKVFPHYGTGESFLGTDKEYKLDQNDKDDNRCMAACLEKGTDINVAGHTMPHFHYGAVAERDFNGSEFKDWFMVDCGLLEVCFMNYAIRERPLEVFWVDSYSGRRAKQLEMEYGEGGTRCFHSYIGHQFEAIDEESGFYEKVTIEHVTALSFGRPLPSSQQKFDAINELEQKVKDVLVNEWRKHQRVQRTFSSLGFAKGKLPDDVFANMAAFYYNNRHNAVSEEWDDDNIFVNWYESDVNFVTIPWNTKKKWQLRLMDMVSAWAGVEVEETAMYGLRQYEKGARLLSHVDRMKTHAVSLIVNVAQDNLARPWPVEVFDHGDRLHEITIEAGEILYYESAKNLHSRNRPLTCKKGGCRFVNLFTHYRPVDDGDKWHSNLSDMSNRPPPLIEGRVDFDTHTSACKRNNNNGTIDNVLGVGTVQCDDHRLGSFISPTLFKARKAEDLFQWWKATADPNLTGFDENNQLIYQEMVYDDDAWDNDDHYDYEYWDEDDNDNEDYKDNDGEYDDTVGKDEL
jgi:hypothetical protein